MTLTKTLLRRQPEPTFAQDCVRTTQTCPASVSASPLSPEPQPRSSSSLGWSSGSASSSRALSVRAVYSGIKAQLARVWHTPLRDGGE